MKKMFLCLLLLLPLLAMAQPPASGGGKEYGRLRGTVKYADTGAPAGKVTVTVTAGDMVLTFVTEANGKFQGITLAGKVVITVLGNTIETTVVPGDFTDVEILVRKLGVLLTYTEGARITRAFATYAPAATPDITVAGIRQGGNLIWFPDVPAQARTLTVYLRINSDFMPTIRLQWAFTEDAEHRALAVELRRPEPQTLLILDEQGNPMPNVEVNGTLTLEEAVDWLNAPFTRRFRQTRSLTGLRTDARGALRLGANYVGLPPGDYTITLASDVHVGTAVSFTVDAGGQASIDRYQLVASPRTVTQTVFGNDGKPLPRAVVYASYCHRDTAHIRQAVSDERGIVVWDDMPPSRLITWGPRVPVGVVPVGVTEVTAPLPAPALDSQVEIKFRPTNLTDPVTVSRWQINHRTGAAALREAQYDPGARDPTLPWQDWGARSGERISVVFLLEKPLRVACLDEVYVPYNEYGRTVCFPITFQPAPEIRGRWTLPDGRPVPGVSRLGIVPAEPRNVPGALRRPELTQLGLMRPVETGNGAFTVRVPAAGAYRLLVDLFDEQAPTPPSLVIEVEPGLNLVTVPLPEPLALVPAGTVARCLTRHAPAASMLFNVAAHAPQMPIFGPRDHLLLVACRTAPDRLLVWKSDQGEGTTETLALRDVTLSFRATQGWPLRKPMTLRPLLPPARNEALPRAIPDLHFAEAQRLIMDGPQTYRLRLWPGAYQLQYGDPEASSPEQVATLEVPARGEAALTAAFEESNPGAYRARSLTVTLPEADFARLRTTAASFITLAYNVSSGRPRPFPLSPGKTISVHHVPPRATTCSLTWLGVGTIRDLPLGKPEVSPHSNQEAYRVTAPAWEPGATVSGRVLQADGAPFVKKRLKCSLGNTISTQSIGIVTDELGGFTVQGMPPGTLCIYLDEGDIEGGWALDVPATGLDAVLLRLASAPIIRKLAWYGNEQLIWWIPNGGTARRLPSDWSRVICHDPLPIDEGWLWSVDNAVGSMQCLYTTLAPGETDLSGTASVGGGVGIVIDAALAGGMPVGLRLEGQGRLAAIRAEFPAIPWHPVSPLGLVAAQLDSVPPGVYRLSTDTPAGVMEGTVTITPRGGLVTLRPPARVNGPSLRGIAEGR